MVVVVVVDVDVDVDVDGAGLVFGVVVGIFSLPLVGIVLDGLSAWIEVRVDSLGSEEGSPVLLGAGLAPPQPAINARISAESKMPADVRTWRTVPTSDTSTVNPPAKKEEALELPPGPLLP